jgi:hypothetical protein
MACFYIYVLRTGINEEMGISKVDEVFPVLNYLITVS